MLLTVPFAARWHYIPHDYWRFTPSGLERLLGTAGFGTDRRLARGNALTVACYKVMALFLPWIFAAGPVGLRRRAFQLCGLLTTPVLIALASVGWFSIAAACGGNDCLGYTVVAFKRSETGRPEV